MSQQKRRLTLEELKARGYRPGSIVRVKMVNFITYDDAEVFPGPRLNVVLGPNGTGKSTLTHAICLACAGSTGTVGRSGELKQFVKKGKEDEPEKYVEVDMMKSNDIVTIRRDLSGDDNSSHWYLNSKSVPKKTIKDLMVQMSVDVDNLCSFMAQDKVGNFTLQSPKEMLQTTLKSIRDREENKTLYEIQMELASKEQMKLSRQRDLDAKVQQVHMLTQEIEGLRPEVERIYRRNDLKRLIELYNIKRVVLTNREGREHVRLKQLACDEASKALATEQEKFQPLRNRERELERLKAIEDKTIEQSRKARKKTEDAVRVLREALDDADLATNTTELELARYSDKRRNVEQSLANLTREAQDHQKHYDKLMAAKPKIDSKMTEVGVKITAKSDDAQRLEEEIHEVMDHSRQLMHERQRLEQDLGNLRNPQQIFKKKLVEKNYPDIRRAMEWLEANRSSLKGECYGPAGAYMAVQDNACAAILEKSIGKAKLLAFVVDNSGDYDTIQSAFKSMGLRGVDVYTMNHRDKGSGGLGTEVLKRTKTFGVVGYFTDQVAMPELIRCYLNSFSGFHHILWAKGEGISKSLSSEQLSLLSDPERGGSYRLFAVNVESKSRLGFSSISEYNGSRGRAGDAQQNLLPNISLAQWIEVGGSGDADTVRDNLNVRLTELKKEQSHIEKTREMKATGLKDVNHEIAGLKAEKIELMKTLKEPGIVAQKIDLLKKKIADCESFLSRDSEAERAQLQENFRSAIENQITLMTQLQEKVHIVLDAHAETAVVECNVKGIGTELQQIKQQIRDAEVTVEHLKTHVKEAASQRDQAQREQASAVQEFEALQVKAGSKAVFEDQIRQVTESCPEGTIEDVNLRIEGLKFDLDSAVDNPEVVTRFQNAERERDHCLQEQTQLLNAVQNAEAEMQTRLTSWIDSVKNVASKLSHYFAEFMQALQYDGLVSMKETNTIDNYEIVMMVKFRKDTDLAELDGKRQSGGERAVSTIMYLMALLELTSSPFRVVDEINQGMDERNERLVFDRIVQSCCEGEVRPQYFLVSPKLLQGLRAMAHDNVTVLMVWNGAGVFSKWQIEDVVTCLQKKRDRLLRDSAGDDGDASTDRGKSVKQRSG